LIIFLLSLLFSKIASNIYCLGYGLFKVNGLISLKKQGCIEIWIAEWKELIH